MDAREICGLAIVVGYWAVLIGTRWMFIARPNRRFTLARIDDAQYVKQRDADKGEYELLDEARAIAGLCEDDPLRPPWLRQNGNHYELPKPGRLRRMINTCTAPLMWNGSRDLVAWMLLHYEQARAAGKLEGPLLRAALIRAQGQLSDLPTDRRNYWAKYVAHALKPSTSDDDARAVLEQCLGEIYDVRDTKFVNLATQQNKVTWLILVALTLMAALVTLGYEIVLLAGAVGGVLSRLQREMTRRDVPSDYGLSWAVLFLSPVTGALSAWAGLFVLLVLKALGVIDLEAVLPATLKLTDPTDGAIALAIVLGFSERFFQGIVGQVTKQITPEESAAQNGHVTDAELLAIMQTANGKPKEPQAADPATKI
jgi:hypothetical protein